MQLVLLDSSSYTKWKFICPQHRPTTTQNATNALPPFELPLSFIHSIMTHLRQFGTELSVNRVANRESTPEARGFMFGAAAAGESHSRIAKASGAKDSSTVSHTINRMHTRKTGVTANRRRGKYKTTPRDERHFVVLARKYPEATYWDIIRRAGLEITPRTCKKVLQRHYLGSWRKAQRILLTEEDAQIRRELAEKYSRPEELQHFMRGLFSDECTIRNSSDNPGQWVFRLASERFWPDLVDTESHGRPPISIMV
jgi:hypothetical protein